jgi:hypothetical protein
MSLLTHTIPVLVPCCTKMFIFQCVKLTSGKTGFFVKRQSTSLLRSQWGFHRCLACKNFSKILTKLLKKVFIRNRRNQNEL